MRRQPRPLEARLPDHPDRSDPTFSSVSGGVMNKLARVVLLVYVQVLAGCGTDGPSSRSLFGPSAGAPPVAQPAAPTLRLFTEPGTGFSTTALRDVHDHIVQFNSA